jgi:lipid-A-disaccharide synthase
MSQRAFRIVLVAGEASGDQLGAGLIEALRERLPNAQFFGVGGDRMQEAGLQAWFDASELSVMGLVEVIKHLPRLLRRRRQVIAETLQLAADLFIGIDAPDFNLAIAKTLKARGIHTMHYVSPSIWAWRPQRAKKIAQCVDRVLCLFPFEPALYAQYQVAAVFVGHPLADQFPLEPAPMFARTALGLPLSGPILALLPGSRSAEISALAGDFLDAAALLKTEFPKLTVTVAIASERAEKIFDRQLREHHSAIKFIGQAQLVLQAADIVMVASGTAALEAALARKPMVVAYRVNALTYFIARRMGLLQSQYFSLPNKLAERALVPELEQDQVSATALADTLREALTELALPPDKRSDGELQLSYLDMHLQLRQNASQRAADAVLRMLAEKFPDAA